MTVRTPTRAPGPAFWRDRRVLVTGHTGFKGSWLTAWLHELGAVVAGLALPELPTHPALSECLEVPLALDIRADVCSDEWKAAAVDFDPAIIVHLAAQSLVSEGFAAPYRTFQTNVLGTANLLNTLRDLSSVQAVLVATTDKVYDDSEVGPHTESSRLGGHDPYSASKVATELVAHSWPEVSCPVVTARAGNVIGGGDWGRHRLIPDLVRSWSADSEVELRRPNAVRPWQHVLEPLCGYLVYLEELVGDPTLPRSLNFGPSGEEIVKVRDVVGHAAQVWARAFDLRTPPVSVTSGPPAMDETDTLTIDSAQANEVLGWQSVLDWRAAVALTIDWYAEFTRSGEATGTLLEQLRAYSGLMGRGSS